MKIFNIHYLKLWKKPPNSIFCKEAQINHCQPPICRRVSYTYYYGVSVFLQELITFYKMLYSFTIVTLICGFFPIYITSTNELLL